MVSIISDRSYKAFGLVAVASAELDMELAGVLVHLLQSGRAHLVVAGQSFTQLDHAIVGLSKGHLDEPAQKMVNDLLTRARQLHRERDLVVHGLWLPTDIAGVYDGQEPTEHYAVRSRRWRAELQGKVVRVEEVEQLGAELQSLAATVRKFREDYLPVLDPEEERSEAADGDR